MRSCGVIYGQHSFWIRDDCRVGDMHRLSECNDENNILSCDLKDGFWIWWSNLLDLYTTGYNSSQITIWHTVIFFDWTLEFWPLFTTPVLRCTPSRLLTVSSYILLGTDPTGNTVFCCQECMFIGPLGLMTRYLLLFDSYGLVFVGRPLWQEDGSVFCICCWPSPGSLSRVWVPWDSWPYFTVSVLRLPFSSPPTTRRVTVEVFDPASTRVNECPIYASQYICFGT
jgi:hypothetical protein